MNTTLPSNLARFQRSPNTGGRFAPGRLDTLVIHYTAGASLQSSVDTLCNPASKASAHLVVGRDGAVVQLVELDVIAWHAGASRHAGRVGLNAFSIGIEIDNAGRLTQTADGGFVTWFGKQVPKSEAILATHRNESTAAWWHTYTEAQLNKVFELAQMLVEGLGLKHVVGHEEIAPGRKSDPGPAFPLDRLRTHVLGTGRNVETAPQDDQGASEGIVAASLLNLRSAPSANSPLAGTPLRRGTIVSVIALQPGWLRVASPIPGWVKREFVQLSADVRTAAAPGAEPPSPGPGNGDRPGDGSGGRPDSGEPRPDSGGTRRVDTGDNARPG